MAVAKFESGSFAQQNTGVSATFVIAAAPAGLQIGELIVAVLGSRVLGNGALLSGPATWTKRDQSKPAGFAAPKCAFWTKVADAGDLAGNYSFTNDNSELIDYVGGVMRISNDLGFDGFAVATIEDVAQSSMPTPSLVTVASSALIIRVPMAFNDSTKPTDIVPPAGITERGEEIVATGFLYGSWNTENIIHTPAGATGVETFEQNGAGAVRAVMYTIGIASADPPPPGGGPAGGPANPFRLLAKRWRELGTGA